MLTDATDRAGNVANGAVATDAVGADETRGKDAPKGEASLVSNTMWSIGAEGIRLISSVVTFLILTELYGPEQFGVLVATTGLFGFVFPQASAGAGWLLLRRLTNDGWSIDDALARAAGMVVLGGALFGAIMLAIRPLLLPQASVELFIGLAISELIFVGLVEVTLFAAQATEKLIVKAAVWTTYGVGRAAGALLLLLLVDSPDLGPWILINGVVAMLVLLTAQWMTVGRLIAPVWPQFTDFRQGVPYSLGFGADRIRDVADAVILVRVGFEGDAGLFSAARRLVNVTQAPIIAGLHAVNARIWRAGARSACDARSVAVRCSAIGSFYSIVVAIGMIVVGGPMAALLSEGYEETGTVLVWMSPLPLLLALEIFPAMALTASGYNQVRVLLSLGVGAVNVGLNLALIPEHGWRGATIAALASGGFHVVALWIALQVFSRRDHRQGEAKSESQTLKQKERA